MFMNVGRKGSDSCNRSMQPSILSDSVLPKVNQELSDYSQGLESDTSSIDSENSSPTRCNVAEERV